MSKSISESKMGCPGESDRGEVDVIVDLADCTRNGKAPPKSKKGYKVKINGDLFVICSECVTGRAILEIAGLIPPERYSLRVKLAGQRPKRIELDEKVDLTQPGIEKFKALPRDQTEGSHGT